MKSSVYLFTQKNVLFALIRTFFKFKLLIRKLKEIN